VISKEEIQLPNGFTQLMIAVPTLSGEIRVQTVSSLLRTTRMLVDYQIPYDIVFVIGNSAVERARNELTKIFLDHDHFSHMLQIDSDMDWDEVEVLRLLSDNHDVVFGAGVKKRKPSYMQPQFAMTVLDRESPVCPLCGCIEVKAGGACFLMTSRKAIEQIMEKFPDLKYKSDTEESEFIPAIFNPYLDEKTNLYYAEDIAFFHRWRETGGKVWLDPRIDLGHWGNARWSGDLKKLFSIMDSKEG
jgi:hypothetical protein